MPVIFILDIFLLFTNKIAILNKLFQMYKSFLLLKLLT